MKNFKWMSLALVAMFAVACDPYDDEKTGTPNIASVTVADFDTLHGFSATQGAGGAWTVNIDCAALTEAYCGPDFNDPEDPADGPGVFTSLEALTLFVSMDRQFDGLTVQESLSSCAPAGSWLTVSTPAPTGTSWFSCYSPGSPTPGEGGSVVIFTSATPTAPATVDNWEGFDVFPIGTTQVTGTVADRAIDVTVTTVDPTTCAPCTDPAPSGT
jgi:hypothetical protein